MPGNKVSNAKCHICKQNIEFTSGDPKELIEHMLNCTSTGTTVQFNPNCVSCVKFIECPNKHPKGQGPYGTEIQSQYANVCPIKGTFCTNDKCARSDIYSARYAYNSNKTHTHNMAKGKGSCTSMQGSVCSNKSAKSCQSAKSNRSQNTCSGNSEVSKNVCIIEPRKYCPARKDSSICVQEVTCPPPKLCSNASCPKRQQRSCPAVPKEPPCSKTVNFCNKPVKCTPCNLMKRKGTKQMYKTSFESWTAGCGSIDCPKCNKKVTPLIRKQKNKVAFSSLGASLLLTCWPFCFLIPAMHKCSVDLYCPCCKNKLGVYNSSTGKVTCK